MEKNQSEYVTVERRPPVRINDLKNGLVKVEMLIPGLKPTRDRFNPREGEIKLDFLNSGRGIDMKATMTDTKNKKITIYKLRVKELPGKININESDWKVEKGQIVITMQKHPEERNVDWTRAFLTRGLDQASSSSSSDSDDS